MGPETYLKMLMMPFKFILTKFQPISMIEDPFGTHFAHCWIYLDLFGFIEGIYQKIYKIYQQYTKIYKITHKITKNVKNNERNNNK